MPYLPLTPLTPLTPALPVLPVSPAISSWLQRHIVALDLDNTPEPLLAGGMVEVRADLAAEIDGDKHVQTRPTQTRPRNVFQSRSCPDRDDCD